MATKTEGFHERVLVTLSKKKIILNRICRGCNQNWGGGVNTYFLWIFGVKNPYIIWACLGTTGFPAINRPVPTIQFILYSSKKEILQRNELFNKEHKYAYGKSLEETKVIHIAEILDFSENSFWNSSIIYLVVVSKLEKHCIFFSSLWHVSF